MVDILEEEVRMEKTSRQNKSPKLILSGPVCVSADVGWRRRIDIGMGLNCVCARVELVYSVST